MLPAAVYGPPISARAEAESVKRIKVCGTAPVETLHVPTICAGYYQKTATLTLIIAHGATLLCRQ